MKHFFFLLLILHCLSSSSQNVGIGTNTPSSRLHIISNEMSVPLRIQNTLAGGYTGVHFHNAPGNLMGHIGFANENAPTLSNSFYAGSIASVPFILTSNDTERMRISETGNIGIGTNNPGAPLHIAGNYETLRLSGIAPFLALFSGTDYKGYLWNKEGVNIELGTAAVNTNGNLFISIKGTERIVVQSDGRIGLAGSPSMVSGTAAIFNPAYGLPPVTVNGPLVMKAIAPSNNEWSFLTSTGFGHLVAYSNGSQRSYLSTSDGLLWSFSDSTLKDEIVTYKKVLPGVKELQVATYHYKVNPKDVRSFGLLAQNVAVHFPEIVSSSNKNEGQSLLAIDYSKTGVLALKAIQEQQLLIEQQQRQIEQLWKKLAELEKK